MNITRLLLVPLMLLAYQVSASSTAVSKATPTYKEISWEQLMPPLDEAIIKKYEEGKLSREQAMAYFDQLGVTPVKAMDNQKIEIPGYLIPLDLNKNQTAKELLLVPTLGACIHVPPPPPNQTVYVNYQQGINVKEAGFTPYIIKGTLHVEKNTTQHTETLYSLTIDSIEEYK